MVEPVTQLKIDAFLYLLDNKPGKQCYIWQATYPLLNTLWS